MVRKIPAVLDGDINRRTLPGLDLKDFQMRLLDLQVDLTCSI